MHMCEKMNKVDPTPGTDMGVTKAVSWKSEL